MKSEKEYFGIGKIPIGMGVIIKGWDVTNTEYMDPNRLPVVDFRAMTSACPHECIHCFTEKIKTTLSIEELKEIVDQLAEFKTKGINYVGEGEPTIDKNFFEILEYTISKGIQPVIFTDAATKLTDRSFLRRVYETGASICPKCDSLYSAEYQNKIVNDKSGNYFNERNKSIELMIAQGFNEICADGTTRMGFDMVLSTENSHEVEKTLRYCRDNNIWITFSFFLPTGRSGKKDFENELMICEEQRQGIRVLVQEVDREYGFDHNTYTNFLTMPCVEYIQIFGNGNVSPCPGNDTIIGNVHTNSIREIKHRLYTSDRTRDPVCFDGNCPLR